MKLVILIKTVSSQGQNHHVVESKGSYCTVGREGSQVILKDPKCSRQHAILYEEADGSLWLRDLESSNGTYLEDERVEKAPIKVGEEFRIGSTRLEILSFQSVEATAKVKPEKKKKKTKAREGELENGDGPTASQQVLNIVTRWPDNISCLPKEKQAEFARFTDGKRRGGSTISFRKPK